MQAPEPDDLAIQEIAACLLPGPGQRIVQRAAGGDSTPVYRIRRGDVTLYLRLAESPEASLAPEALAHRLLRERAVRLPEVVHVESFNEALGRSLMVTTEIPGAPLGASYRGVDVDAISRAAGHDLALIHTIPVDGFGWIRRDPAAWTKLRGARAALRSFALEDLAAHLGLLRAMLSDREIRAIEREIADGSPLLSATPAVLVHGDFDATHIYHRHGRYSGIIDFGEIRGADPCYDLGHVALHDGEKLPQPILPALLAGYAGVTPLPPDHMPRIRLWSLLIGVRALARSVSRPASAYQRHLVGALRRVLAEQPT